MTLLRVYDPKECDGRGVPRDWERCRTCDGEGRYMPPKGSRQTDVVACDTCVGHGSLKAAVQVYLEAKRNPTWLEDSVTRCEECRHPMPTKYRDTGKWLPSGDGAGERNWWTLYARSALRDGREPEGRDYFAWMHDRRVMPAPSGFSVNVTPCDEECEHTDVASVVGREVREILGTDGPVGAYVKLGRGVDERIMPPFVASWRMVDVRCLGWPHDLRPKKVALLCLRCWAARA